MKDDKTPLLTNIPKWKLDRILGYLFLNESKYSKKRVGSLPFNGNRHHYFLFQYYKDFQLASRMLGNVSRPFEGRQENLVTRIKKK